MQSLAAARRSALVTPALALALAALAASCGGSKGLQLCSTSAGCDSGQVCVEGVCQASGGGLGSPGELGTACGARTDCNAGLGCLTQAVGFPGGTCSSTCDSAPCPVGVGTCVDLTSTSAGAKACLRTCTAEADCRTGYTCCAALGGACAPANLCPALNSTNSPTLGAACAANAQCTAGETCKTGASWPGGVCTRACTAGDPATCPGNGACAQTTAGPLCFHGCTVANDCRAGWSCEYAAGTSGAKVCKPSTTGGSDGGSDGGTGSDGGSDGGTSGDGGTGGTDGGTGSDGGTGGSDAGFPASRTCTPPGTRQVVNGGTVGPATAPTTCQKPVQASSLTGLQKQAFGTHNVNDVIHFTVPANTGGVTIVQQAVSATEAVTYQGQSIANASVPTALKNPAGALLYDDNAAPPADGTTAKVWYALASPVTGVMTLPNTTAMLNDLSGGTFPAGQWSVTVNDYANECGSTSGCSGGDANGKYDVSVLLRPGPVPASGTVDVAFYLVSNSHTAASAIANAKMTRMLDTLATIYGRAGLCLGKVTFYDVPAWAKTKYATGVKADKTGPCDELDQMFTLSKTGENTLNFFLVDDIGQTGSSGGGTIVGIDGAIPGPSSVGGTVKSGAVVNVSDLAAGVCSGTINFMSCGADSVAYITAHEGGHWMGLYHTTESIGGLWDPLSDTPKCECNATCVGSTAAAKCCDPNTGQYPDHTACDANMTRLNGTSCNSTGTTKPTCQGADLLMFWLIDSTSKGNFSAEQGKVVRSNPIVQ